MKRKAQLDIIAATGYGREVSVCLCTHMQAFLLTRVKVKAKKENKEMKKVMYKGKGGTEEMLYLYCTARKRC